MRPTTPRTAARARTRVEADPPVPGSSSPSAAAKQFAKSSLHHVAGLLPPPRDQALVGVAREAYRLVTGRGPRRSNRSARRGVAAAWRTPIDWRRATAAFERGDLEQAATILDRILDVEPDATDAIRLLADVQGRRGDLTGAVRAVRKLRRVRDDGRLAEQERRWVGRLVETDPRWLPRIPGPAREVHPVDHRVMHLLKESLPYRQNGFTMRSRYTLLAQRAAGLDPFVVTSLGFPRRDGVEDHPSVELVDGIAHHRLDLGNAYPVQPPFDRHLTTTASLMADVAERERPSILHASSGFRGYELALVGLALRRHLSVPLVYEVRSFLEATWTGDVQRAEQGEHYRRRYETERRCMLEADAVITIADAMAGDIAARGVPEERIHVVPNGVDPEAFEPMPPDQDLIERYGLAGKVVFGYVSNLDHPREGQETLIDATARLIARGANVACLIVGDGDRRAILEERARRVGARDAVVFTGRVPHDEVRRHYSVLDVFVVPRVNDHAARYVTPLKPFEAMAMARPLVVSNLPALVEIAAPGERSLTFPAGDVEGLADALWTLIEQPGLRAAFGDAGRRWVTRERTWRRNGDRYREIYDEVLDRRRGREARIHVA